MNSYNFHVKNSLPGTSELPRSLYEPTVAEKCSSIVHWLENCGQENFSVKKALNDQIETVITTPESSSFVSSLIDEEFSSTATASSGYSDNNSFEDFFLSTLEEMDYSESALNLPNIFSAKKERERQKIGKYNLPAVYSAFQGPELITIHEYDASDKEPGIITAAFEQLGKPERVHKYINIIDNKHNDNKYYLIYDTVDTTFEKITEIDMRMDSIRILFKHLIEVLSNIHQKGYGKQFSKEEKNNDSNYFYFIFIKCLDQSNLTVSDATKTVKSFSFV